MSRHSLPSDLESVVCSARGTFSKRSWLYLLSFVSPWILCAGQRCVTRIFAMRSHSRSLSGYYRFLSEGKIRVDLLFRLLFDLILRVFPTVSLTVVVDDTLVPKWGRKIFGTGYHHDHVKRPKAGVIWGHNWVVLAVVVSVGSGAWVALPFWIKLYRTRKTVRRKADFRTRIELAVEGLRAVRTWFSGPITVLTDGAYNNGSLILPLRPLGLEVVSRLRSDAALRDLTPPRKPKGKRGPAPKRGLPLPSLAKLASVRSAFRELQVAIYGKQVTLLVREIVAYWKPVDAAVKLVITRDPRNPGRLAYLMTTNLALSATEVIELFARRWTVEQLFSTMKCQLGLDSAEVRTENSVRRHAALSVAMATWVEVWAWRKGAVLRARSFSTKIGALRQAIVTNVIFEPSPRGTRSRRVSKGVASLFAAATSAA